MEVPFYQVDAFTSRLFGGNPAAVCPLQRWLDDSILQSIAAEHNLSDTAFFVPEADGFHLRWFTPVVEMELCGHATLASGYILMRVLEPRRREVHFRTLSGVLAVTRDGDLFTLDFPAKPAVRVDAPRDLTTALGREPLEVWSAARDYMAVYESEEEVRAIQPDMARLARVDKFATIVTAPGQYCDFVSRFFSPKGGIPEDPVTGSAHCTLAPYWANRLGKTKLEAHQVSARGGELICEVAGDRVKISGSAVLYSSGKLHLAADRTKTRRA
jgi:PhzF family phenazine biosynthesis protein